MSSTEETCVPHIGWLRHPRGDDVATYLRQGWFEYREQAFLWLYLRPGDHVIDCGAHLGLFSILAHRATEGRGTVIAVEPDPGTLPCLRQNLAANGAGAVEIIEAAAWSKAGDLTLHVRPRDRAAYSSAVMRAPDGADVPVAAITLDELVERYGLEHVALLKIDVEGAEREVWEGSARSVAAGRLPLALVEFTAENQRAAGQTTAQLAEAWRADGYAFYRFDESALQLAPVTVGEDIEHENLLATRDADPINDRLRGAPPERQRVAREILARGAEAFSLLKRALDAEHLLETHSERYEEMCRRAGHYAFYICRVHAAPPVQLLRALRLVKAPGFLEQARADIQLADNLPKK